MLQLAIRAESPREVTQAQMMLADSLAMAGDAAGAIPLLQAALAETRRLGQPTSSVISGAMLSAQLALAGDVDAARCTAGEAWPLACEHGLTEAFLGLGVLVAALRGELALAARLLGFGQRRDAAAAPMRWYHDHSLVTRSAALLAGWPEAERNAEHQRGMDLSPQQGQALLHRALVTDALG